MENLIVQAEGHQTFANFLQGETLKSGSPEIIPFIVLLESGKEVYDFISAHINIESKHTLVLSASSPLELKKLEAHSAIVNLRRVNDIRYINKFFEAVNAKLSNGDMFAGTFETFSAKQKRQKIGRIPVLREIFYTCDFLFHRVFPKVPLFKKLYFFLTKGRNRVLSKAEALGRLVSCGFEIVDVASIGSLCYFVAKKEGKPKYDMAPSYGPFYKMPRLGKNGKIIGVYKLRTMHPYSEYLHDYILKTNGYAETGKPANDFRLTPWAKFIRKYWLDELPQLINLVKGELKLVGVRPISQRYFQDIPEDLQKLRLTQKPGCIPPYVALDRKGSVEDVLQAEREYLEEKLKRPYTTDMRYFFRAVFNIIFRNKRSA